MKINTYHSNIQPSFRSLYIIKAKDNANKIDEIIDLSDSFFYWGNGISSSIEFSENNHNYSDSTIRFVGKDSYDDNELEMILANMGIIYTKKSFSELNSADNIKSRIELSPDEKAKNYTLIEIDRIKFDKAYEDYGFAYIGHSGNISHPERTENFKEYLKTGKSIYAPVVYINDAGEYPEITFADGRHRYAYMRDIEMNGIPIAMNEESIRIAKKYGLLFK